MTLHEIPSAIVGGRTVVSSQVRRVIDPWSGNDVGIATEIDSRTADLAVRSALEGFAVVRSLSSGDRAMILQRVTAALRENREFFARLITAEAGKPIRFSRAEVERAVTTFETASEEAKRIGGETIPLDWNALSAGRTGIVRRYPVGVILGITPFNFPLNLVAHKVAPAIAAGNAILLKPAPQTPLTALALGTLLLEAGYPPEALSVFLCPLDIAESLVADPRISMLTFTGSPAVGWRLRSLAGKKKVVLELGGNAGAIIDRTADVDDAVERTAMGAFAYSGQVCIKVQRILVHQSLRDEFTKKFVRAANEMTVGNPSADQTVVGPVIDRAAAERITSWVEEAIAEGAKKLTSRQREGSLVPPTVLENVPTGAKVSCEEVFGPVVTMESFTDFHDAVGRVNASRYGLQAGVFTNDLDHAWYAFDNLQVGGVILNDAPTYRSDQMPYGGVKDSGMGREGVKYAVESMTEPKLLAIRTKSKSGHRRPG